MKSPHPTATDFEHYILGALGPEAAARLEAHTLECPVCARRLHQEALLEERLREVARAPRGATVLRPARWHAVRKAAVLVGGLAAAALALLMAPPPGALPGPAAAGGRLSGDGPRARLARHRRAPGGLPGPGQPGDVCRRGAGAGPVGGISPGSG
jgi:anti-sigma factor RsiW